MSGSAVRIGVLSKKSLTANPYRRWLAPYHTEVTLFAQDDPGARAVAERGDGYRGTALFPDWKANRTVDLAVLDEHRARPLHRIVALSECDQVRAAQLRERLGLPGQTVAAATAFRDKLVMKSLAAGAGLDVPGFAAVEAPCDILDFIDRNGWPVVVKPRDGAGSEGVEVLRTPAELTGWLGRASFVPDEPARYLVEEYLDAPILVVDGVMAGQRIVVATVSEYTNSSCLGAVHDGAVLGMMHLDPAGERARRAREYLSALLLALPGAVEAQSFHTELFEHPIRGPVLCEIACRTGGARFPDMFTQATGVNLEHWSCLGQAGLDPVALFGPARPTGRLAGSVVVPGPGRTLVRAPRDCPLPGVVDVRVKAEPGEFVPRASKIAHLVVDSLFAADDERVLADLLAQLVAWIDDEVVWD